MKQYTLCLLRKADKILLGMKKRGYGEGKYNAFGGKPKENEEIKDAAIRELQEEINIKALNIEKKGELMFLFQEEKSNHIIHIFSINDWIGEPMESDEMKPEWFSINAMPYERMWEADKEWIPYFLQNKFIDAVFMHDKDEKIIKKEIKTR